MSQLPALPETMRRTEKTHAIVLHLLQEKAGLRSVLDTPSGVGTLAPRLRDLGLEVTCLDVSEDAPFPEGVRGVRADLNRPLPLEDGSFDAVVCVEGIEHVENPHHMLREFHRILRPNGWLLLSTPNILTLRSRWKFFFTGRFAKFSDFESGSDPLSPLVRGHINPVGYPELEFALATHGFRVDAVHANHLRSYHPWFAGLVRLVLGLRRPKHHPHHARLLTDTLLFGENLIVVAQRGERRSP